MLTGQLALDRLNKEKDFEEKLAADLNRYFLSILEDIEGLTEEEKQRLKHDLEIIYSDSLRHGDMFNNLVQMVFEDSNENY